MSKADRVDFLEWCEKVFNVIHKIRLQRINTTVIIVHKS